uniref:Reverse transcriptase domain-containing protein n=1 Tax=Tanacetum cinerariifolium TaxID=118510 RepID=A0A6L2M9R1_TANCI|nr:reverse transcriptase domain-containing protein [Tanacetum cinerariifolium]
MANTTPIVTTVTKPATNPRDVDATPRFNIQDSCEKYYEDILPIIMDKVRRDKRKEVHARLDLGEVSRERTREGSRHSSARTLTARPERLKVQDRLRYNDRHVLDRLGHRRQSAFDRFSETYSPSTTKSRPGMTSSRNHPRDRSRPRRLDASNKGRPENRKRFCSVGESYDDSHSHSYHDRDRSRHMKRRRASESSLSSVSGSDSSDGRYQKSKSKRHKPIDEDDLTIPWMCEEVDPFTPRIRNFKSSRRTRMPNNVKTYDGTEDLEDHVKVFQAAAHVERWVMPTWCHMFNSTLIGAARQKKYVKDPVEIHNIKQKDEETIEDFMERFKVETGRMKGALNTMEEMMITTTTFIRGEAAAASKKKGKFQPSPPMVTPVEKRSSNKFCDFHNDKRHSTIEFMQLKKQIEELVRACKLSHLIKEIKHGRDQEITFPPLANSSGAEGPLVKEAEIGGHMIHRMYVDGCSSMKILYEHCFNQLRPEVKNQMVPVTISLTGFSGETIWPLGQLRLLVTIGDVDHSISMDEFHDSHGMLKFPVDGGIVTIRSTILIPAECATVITSSAVLKEPSDITGVPPSVAEHRLNIREGYSPVRQKKRSQASERAKAIQAEVQKLVEARLMRESHTEAEMLKDIGEMFRTLRKINMKLNPKKCTFVAVEGMFLGYMVTPKGIKPCPDKTEAVLQLPSPRTIKEVQSLNGKLASLNIFLFKSAEKSLPLFKTLKKCIKKSDFYWTSEAEQAFKQVKQHLSELPLLVAPKPKEELIVYLSGSYRAISAVLMTERGTVQTPVYFVSRALHGPELNYTPMENLVLSLVFTANRLRRYFQAHPIAVNTDQPIKQIMSRPDVAGRLQKWSVMLGGHNITYRTRTSMKGQVLANFLAEMPDESPPAALVVETQQEPLTLFTNGSSCVDRSGAGLILTSLEEMKFTYALRFQFAAFNNEAEYEALIVGLQIAAHMGV